MTQLLDWQATWENTTKTGIGGKLIKLKKSAGDNAFKTRVLELYPAINDLNMKNVKFELSKIMFGQWRKRKRTGKCDNSKAFDLYEFCS